MNDNPDAAANSGPPAKPRSKVERTIVWTLIGVLLIVMLIELRAQLGFQHAYNALNAALEADVEDHSEGILTEAEAKQHLAGRAPVQSEALDYRVFLASRVDSYEWPSLLKTRALHIYYGVGDNPDVVSVTQEKTRTRASYEENNFNEHRAAAEENHPATTDGE